MLPWYVRVQLSSEYITGLLINHPIGNSKKKL